MLVIFLANEEPVDLWIVRLLSMGSLLRRPAEAVLIPTKRHCTALPPRYAISIDSFSRASLPIWVPQLRQYQRGYWWIIEDLDWASSWVLFAWAWVTSVYTKVRAQWAGGERKLSRIAYEKGAGSFGIPWLCTLGAMTGIGATAGFSGALKTGNMILYFLVTRYWHTLAALNYPFNRGAATALPLSGFGLSAFFFSIISSLAFPDNAGDLLLLLASLTFAMPFAGAFFLWTDQTNHGYAPVSKSEDGRESISLGRLPQSKFDRDIPSTANLGTPLQEPVDQSVVESLPSTPPESLQEDKEPLETQSAEQNPSDDSDSDIRGFAMFKYVKFYRLWVLLGLLTGTGLMTIKWVNHDGDSSVTKFTTAILATMYGPYGATGMILPPPSSYKKASFSTSRFCPFSLLVDV